MRADMDLVRELLENGAQGDLKTGAGKTAAELAQDNEREDIAKVIHSFEPKASNKP